MTLRIFGHDYIVETRNALGAFGKASLGDSRIYIDSDMTPEQRLSTILHEALEMMNMQLELGMPHAAICGIETGMYQFLTENGIDLAPLEE